MNVGAIDEPRTSTRSNAHASNPATTSANRTARVRCRLAILTTTTTSNRGSAAAATRRKAHDMTLLDTTLRLLDLRRAPGYVDAHCDLPCGVYDPAQARIEAQSVKGCMEKYVASDDPDFKVRATLIKEERADLVKHHLRSEEHTSELQSLRHLVC